jgi:hypothetical protein
MQMVAIPTLAGARRTSHGLHLAATPVFAAMALATMIEPGAPMAMLCSASGSRWAA